MTTDNIFSEENEVKSNFIVWGAPGDFIIGTLVDVRETVNTLSDKKEMQKIYELKAQDGSYHIIDAKKNPMPDATLIKADEYFNIGGKKGIDAQMRNIKIGQILAMKYIEEVPSKTKGYNPTKVIKIYTSGQMDTTFIAGMTADGSEADAKYNAI